MIRFGYTIIYVTDVKQTVDFYQKAFSLQMRFMHESACYAEMETDRVTLAFADEQFAQENTGAHFSRNNSDKKPNGFEIAFLVNNVKDAYEHAIRNGAQHLQAPNFKHWGQEVAYVFDCNNVIVELCSPVK